MGYYSRVNETTNPPLPTMKTLSQIKEVIAANREAGDHIYENLESSEIGRYNAWLMFGDDEEAFPSQAEWAMIAD